MSEIEKLLNKLKQLFCNHTYIDGYKIDANDNVFGYYKKCIKCGKVINL